MQELKTSLNKVVELEKKLGEKVMKNLISFSSANVFADMLSDAKKMIHNALNTTNVFTQTKTLLETENTIKKVSCRVD